MKTRKTTLSLILALLSLLALTACGRPAEGARSSQAAKASDTAAEENSKPAQGTKPAESSKPAESTKPEAAAAVKLKVGATPAPHAEILNHVKETLKKQGIDLEIVEFTDYTSLNPALESGDLDANYFQHIQYLNDFNEKNGTRLTVAGKIHYEPYGLYGGRQHSLKDLKEGAKIAVPNDATNEARALLLLEQAGLLKLKEGAGVLAGLPDIAENPHKLELIELPAEQIPRSLEDLDFAVINGNYAIAAGLNAAKDALVIEAADGEAGKAYANVVAVREDRLKDKAVQALAAALTSEETAAWLKEQYQGAVLPLVP